MKTGVVFGERVRGYLAAYNLPQKALAAALEQDPGYLSRKLDDPEIDAWEAFMIGIGLHRAVTQSQQRQSR